MTRQWASLLSGFQSGPADWKPRKVDVGERDRDVRAFTSQALSLGSLLADGIPYQKATASLRMVLVSAFGF